MTVLTSLLSQGTERIWSDERSQDQNSPLLPSSCYPRQGTALRNGQRTVAGTALAGASETGGGQTSVSAVDP